MSKNSGRSPYRRLDPGLIVETIGQLQARIEARFPQSELADVCAELQRLGEESRRRARSFARPNWLLRLAVLVVMAGALAVIGLVGLELDLDPGTRNLFSLIPSIDAFFNVTVLVGATCFSLFTIEARLIRARAATALRPLRAIIHVIDMHQLTKDPSVDGVVHLATPVSPPHDLTPFELSRYLDYCSEMLSLTAKLAALFALATDDAVVGTAVNEIETLATNLSHKIWQKIMIVHRAAN